MQRKLLSGKLLASKYLQVGLATLLCCSGANADDSQTQLSDDIFGSPFDVCFEHGYNATLVTQDQAYETAECFSELLDKNIADERILGANKHTVLQYSISWYEAAAQKGHHGAAEKLSANVAKLMRHELKSKNGLYNEAQQLLASEKTFKALDTDQNGVLSAEESIASAEVNALLVDADLNNDGQLSFTEYTIGTGEATAAGFAAEQPSTEQ